MNQSDDWVSRFEVELRMSAESVDALGQQIAASAIEAFSSIDWTSRFKAEMEAIAVGGLSPAYIPPIIVIPGPGPVAAGFAWESKPAYVEPDPGASSGTAAKNLADSLGITNRITVSNIGELNAAASAATPGTQIYVAGTITLSSGFSYTGAHHSALTGSQVSGTAANPILLTCAPGVWLDGGLNPSTAGLNRTVVNLRGTQHVGLYGMNLRNCRFGFVSNQSGGTSPTEKAIFRYNKITQMGDSCAAWQGHWVKTGGVYGSSQYWDIRYNEISYAGLERSQYGEGGYIGKGNTGDWTSDTSHHIDVIGNWFHHLQAESVDIKPGTHDIVVAGNLIEDCDASSNAWPGGIVVLFADGSWVDPPANHAPNIKVFGNRFTRNGLVSAVNKQLIVIGHKGVDVIGNVAWANGPLLDRFIYSRSVRSFGNVGDMKVYNNVSFGEQVWGAYDPDTAKQTAIIAATDLQNNVSDVSAGAQHVVAASAFEGPTTGTADAGDGTGSGFRPATGGVLDIAGSDTSADFVEDLFGETITAPVRPGAFA